jgi:hypothetical protein
VLLKRRHGILAPGASVPAALDRSAALGDNGRVANATEFTVAGREREQEQLRRFVEELPGGCRGVVVSGDVGIGKTVLWRASVAAAHQAGARVLVTRCAEAEMPLPLGGLADLIDDVLMDSADDLSPLQGRALAVAVGREAPLDETSNQLLLPRAFLECLRMLAARSPVVVAVDDVQWLDPPSRRILAFAAKRLGDAPVGILVTQRGEQDDPLELHHAFDGRLSVVRVGPLSVGALHHLIRTRLSMRLPRPTVARVHAASGGNPMFALEFAKGSASAGAPLPVPSSLEDLVAARVAGLPPEVLQLLAAVAAAERPTPTFLEAVVPDAVVLLDTASATGAATLAPDGVVRFSHPLLASAAYAAVPLTARRELHARLAAASRDPEEAARHVALSTFEPQEAAAALLDDAAARARARGAPEAAATLVRHASRLTPPADAAGHEERALAAATYLMDAGQTAEAEALLDDLLAGAISGPRRARALLLASVATPDLEVMRRLIEEALEHVESDRALRVRALLGLGTYPLAHGDVAACAAIVREALELAEQLDDPVLLSAALMCVGQLSELRGHPESSPLQRAVALAGNRPPIKGFLTPRMVLTQLHLSAGELPEARALLESELDSVRRWADENLIQRVVNMLFELEWRSGNWDRAQAHADSLGRPVRASAPDRWARRCRSEVPHRVRCCFSRRRIHKEEPDAHRAAGPDPDPRLRRRSLRQQLVVLVAAAAPGPRALPRSPLAGRFRAPG